MDVVIFEFISCDLRFFAWTLTLKVDRQHTSRSAIFFSEWARWGGLLV